MEEGAAWVCARTSLVLRPASVCGLRAAVVLVVIYQ